MNHPHDSQQTAHDPSRRNSGFTLIELVLAVGLLSTAFMSLLLLKASAMQQAAQYNLDRKIQRVAQEKLDEVIYGIEEQNSGSIEEEPTWQWDVEVFSLATVETLYPLLECTLTLRYPSDQADGEGEGEYVLASRFFADENHPLHEYAATDDLNSDTSSEGF